MEIDQPIASGSVDNNDSFRRKVSIAEKALLESGDGQTLARRARKDVLQELCQNRRLDDQGDKIELASRLISWVSATFSTTEKLQSNTYIARHPSTS